MDLEKLIDMLGRMLDAAEPGRTGFVLILTRDGLLGCKTNLQSDHAIRALKTALVQAQAQLANETSPT